MLDVDITGAGPDLVLLHGVPVSPQSVSSIRDRLSTAYRVLTPNMTGIGLAPRPALRALEDALLAHDCPRAPVVAHSFGTYRAFQLALSGAVEVSKLVALGPVAYYPEHARRRQLELARAVEESRLSLDEIVDAVLPKWFRSERIDDLSATIAAARRWFDGLDAAAFVRALRVECDIRDLRPRLAGLHLPTYLGVGEHDRSTPVAWAQRIADVLTDAELDIVDGGGHFLHIECPEDTFNAVEGFLGE
jgi:3-oxoadipate enol-lactonase